MEEINNFYSELLNAILKNTFVKIIISKAKNKSGSLKKITIQKVEIQKQEMLKFVYTHKTQDITKNYNTDDAIKEMKLHLGVTLKNAELFTTEQDFKLVYNKKMEPSLLKAKATFNETLSTSHNKEKVRFVNIENNKYLERLEVLKNGKIAKNMTDKYRQIDKYVQTIDGIIKNSELKNKKELTIVDMGSGKGYLTFATYDYLVNTLGIKTKIVGVELRPELVDLCNDIAKENNFENLTFEKGSIVDYKTGKIDMLIALHACDTATDDAIYKGITSDASIIITAPCCHKQIRKQFDVSDEFKDIVKFGILEERQAEIVTDTIRSLMLEANQYKSQVFEFIADAHTHKNVMIVGTKNNNQNRKKSLEKIKNLKSVFGIKYHYLEKLFNK